MNRLAALVIMLIAALVATISPAVASTDTTTAPGHGGILVNGVEVESGSHPSTPTAVSTSSAPPTKTVTCGYPSSADNGLWNPACGAPRDCPSGPAFATFIEQHGKWVLLDSWCAGDPAAPARPVLTTTALRQQVLRLLPTVQIGTAWTTRALVNAETVLWAQTSSHRDLGTVTVVGQPVKLRIGFDHADWSFGDSTSDTTTSPGKPYTQTDPCNTAQCSDYYGHTYRATGPVTITLTVAWHAQFSLDAGATWTDIDPAPLTGPPATHRLRVIQARGVLVQDP